MSICSGLHSVFEARPLPFAIRLSIRVLSSTLSYCRHIIALLLSYLRVVAFAMPSLSSQFLSPALPTPALVRPDATAPAGTETRRPAQAQAWVLRLRRAASPYAFLSVPSCTNRTTVASSRITSPTPNPFHSRRHEGTEPFLPRIYPLDYLYLVHNLPSHPRPPPSLAVLARPLFNASCVGAVKESTTRPVPQPPPHASRS